MTNKFPRECADMLLHVYAQPTFHGSAQIKGTPDALRRLGEALIKASRRQGQKPVRMMAADGEGYRVEIEALSQSEIERAQLPYAMLGHPWEFERREGEG